jgi:thymidylate kinase
VDRFHLSTRAWQRVHAGRDLDFGWLEARLAAIGFRIVLCVRPPETFEAARAERLEISGKPDQYDDLDVFIREQALFESLAESSLLPVLRLDVSDGDRAAQCERVADWLDATGGLYADY